MKYLKNFENLLDNWLYKKGDWILLLDDKEEKKWKVDIHVKILDTYYRNDLYNYRVKSYHLKDNSESIFWIDEDEIDRKMTLQEIENYIIKKKLSKYNL